MEPVGLHSLVELLNHRYLVRNRLAEGLYGEGNVATYSRLLSRASGRHRFREEEVKGLIRLLNRLAGKLERRAGKLAALELGQLRSDRVLKLLDLPELNLKPIIEQALGPENYYAFYDRARVRGKLPEEWRGAVVRELRDLSRQILTGCEQARQEARQYPFSYGRGGESHLK